MAPFPLTGAASLINKNDNNRNKMIFQHILEDVFQHHQPPQPPASPSPLLEIKRRFEWTLIAQQKHLPIKTTYISTSKTTSEATLIKLPPSSLSSSVTGSSITSHGHLPRLKPPPQSWRQSSDLISSPFTHSLNNYFRLKNAFSLIGVDNEHFYGVNVLCLKFGAGRLTITISRKDFRTCWMQLKSCFVVVTDGLRYDDTHFGLMMETITMNADRFGIYRPSMLLPSSSPTPTKLIHSIMEKNSPDFVSWQEKYEGDTDYGIFIDQRPFHSDHFPIVDLTSSPCHMEADYLMLSPSVSSSSSTSCTLLSPPGSPLFSATMALPLYDNDELDESADQDEPLVNASLLALIQETLQYIHSSPSQHSYSTELESLVPKMGSFLSHSL